MPSRKEIDRAGDRLRVDASDLGALATLFEYCKDVKRQTIDIPRLIASTTSVRVSERAGKSFASIKAKLLRQTTTKLTQIQDIEGCRIIVDSPIEQNALLFRLSTTFPNARIKDHRRAASGYRAVHVIPKRGNAQYEIQIRTMLQHAWAQVSEALSDRFYQELKYIDYGNELDMMLDEDEEWDDRPDITDWVRNLANASASINTTEGKELLLWEVHSGYRDAPIDGEWEKLDGIFRLDRLLSDSATLGDRETLKRWVPAAHAEVLRLKEGLRVQLQELLRELG